MPDSPAVVWFRQDLRLTDNPALHAAAHSGRPVVCAYVLDDETPGRWKAGAAARWWLHQSLKNLGQSIERKGGTLILRHGRAAREIIRLARELEAGVVCWNRCYEPFAIACESELVSALGKAGIGARSCNGGLLHEPEALLTKSGAPHKVFSAFWRALRRAGEPDPPLAAPGSLAAPPGRLQSDRLESWGLLPRKPDLADDLRAAWTPGEESARRGLAHFLAGSAARYATLRDRPGTEGTSLLSPHLHFGEISARTVWTAARDAALSGAWPGPQIDKFLTELGWREFSAYLLFHFPYLPERCLRPEFRNFPWRSDPLLLRAWTRGETGYPLVDAGMRQLRQSGWMHNRARMNAASFLVKHLLQPWQDGAAWFWDALVDADLASNSVNWQWVAGCGADAAPWFRIFNPVLQGERFDPDGAYIRRFVPELARLPDSYIHKPWEAPPLLLGQAGIRLGRDYPRPLVGLREGRERALAAFGEIRTGRRPTSP